MATGLSPLVACVLLVTLVALVSGGDDCKAYRDLSNNYHPKDSCYFGGFCCGSCYSRRCCRDSFLRFTEDKQEDCSEGGYSGGNYATIASSVTGLVILIVIFVSCCVCPCCCLYNMCRKPRPVIATTSHTTVVTNTAQHYPQQPTASPGGQPQSYQGSSYPGYQPVPAQARYGAQPMPQPYGAQPMPQPMPQPYGPQPMPQGYGAQPPAPYPGYTPGPPPPYQEAMGPGYGPPSMAYSQAAFTPGQPSYPLQPPGQPEVQPKAPPVDHGQPAYNPAFAHPPPPHTGY